MTTFIHKLLASKNQPQKSDNVTAKIPGVVLCCPSLYDMIEEFNKDSKAEYSALSSTCSRKNV